MSFSSSAIMVGKGGGGVGKAGTSLSMKLNERGEICVDHLSMHVVFSHELACCLVQTSERTCLALMVGVRSSRHVLMQQ
jgi:hypothetical protein